jgi:hypothetical protein
MIADVAALFLTHLSNTRQQRWKILPLNRQKEKRNEI